MIHFFKPSVYYLLAAFLLATSPISFSQPDDETMKQLQALKQKISNPQKTQDNIFSADLEELIAKKRSQEKSKATSDKKITNADPAAKAAQNDEEVSAEEKQDQLEQAIQEKTFQDMLQKMIPMTPEQIRRLRLKQDEIDLAARGPAGTPPRPVATSQFVSLAPGDKMPIVRMEPGFVTSVVFVDSTGAPWPIELYSLGDPTLFNIAWDKQSNILLMQANQKFKHSNVAVKLMGMNTPVMITLVAGQHQVDYRIDLRVQGLGPKAYPVKLTDGLPPRTNDLLLSLLDGVAPKNAEPAKIKGGNASAWILKKKLYLRTRMTLISPGWMSSMSSPDGMNIYELMLTPLLLVSDHGQIVQLKVEGI